MLVLISYDIVDDKDRLKLMKFLKDYGKHIQKSVFECDLSPEIYQQVKCRVEEIVNKRKDRVRYYRFCNGCKDKLELAGWGELPEDDEFLVV